MCRYLPDRALLVAPVSHGISVANVGLGLLECMVVKFVTLFFSSSVSKLIKNDHLVPEKVFEVNGPHQIT